ncbi:hypothetical protein E4N62_16510 [Streptomyces sp. MNU76]|nr:hypothetical protein [Streptomyces sp. MNU76]MCC9706733.1 hypothetical protein [Streptomyces sp. MNU76]
MAQAHASRHEFGDALREGALLVGRRTPHHRDEPVQRGDGLAPGLRRQPQGVGGQLRVAVADVTGGVRGDHDGGEVVRADVVQFTGEPVAFRGGRGDAYGLGPRQFPFGGPPSGEPAAAAAAGAHRSRVDHDAGQRLAAHVHGGVVQQ